MGWWRTSDASPPARVAEPLTPSVPNVDETLHAPVLPEVAPRPEPLVVPFSTLLVTSAMGLGFISGFANGARSTALVFLAENAHRRPETVQGWYFYNKTKYYRMILGGFHRGGRTGLQLAGWVGGWCLLDILSESMRFYIAEKRGEERPPPMSLDRHGLGHWFDGAVAGVATGLISAVGSPTVPRMVLLGAVAGGTTGALRDLRNALLCSQEVQHA
ncbi:hypothetical protein MNAN1_001890 [Malassezia nana]|uniref:Uncharacterized protein n=1 Tax=Malassezia nana TaxID=180528 RepID=A0AAF0J2A7_9BASI|nr:hypothetical protein MNAN1_001890 [Malassezia nana]